ncbi:MAG: esterase [Comamonas sp. SCN 65-56]|uniref:tannase/feruloyl esterase family alpha/beta hydrolase n=1 Tax=Comamonas sp. SCN 65-56 TaxID=1660095 RepID=UPI000869CE29|nr:tannase/feruloyl esterase family alpha/beta hydrolase [Comamonas sp. SCN 65-56]ODS90794.1 MAG: esterase [Comamonas sp. SCN 65-56]
MRSLKFVSISTVVTCALLSACGGGNDAEPALPQLSAATPGKLQETCAGLAAQFHFPNTEIGSAEDVAAGVLKVAGRDVPGHCLVKGSMYQRAGVNGNYAIAFEMRLPTAWNGRFFYQANGGTDGSVQTATGGVNGGGALTNALSMGFAVISSDAGHNAAQNASGPANFGVDPQARLDYGYQTVAKLTPMAKGLIKDAYHRGPDRSYIGGCSNGGRHTMVAAARYANDYDGFLVGDPGFNLPLAATANIAGYQQYLALAAQPGDAASGFTQAERSTVASAILGKCDALDGVADGMVQNSGACKTAFDLDRDVPTCTASRDGSCLTAGQKAGIRQLFTGVKTPDGQRIYASWPYDNGIQTGGWSFWKFTVPMILDSVAVGQVWMSPPMDAASFSGPIFAATADIAEVFRRIHATSGSYPESALSFMTPPNPTDLSLLKQRGAKMMVYHGTADPIFSSDDTTRWYESLMQANDGSASNFARYYPIAGMNHCSGGPATDQFDMLTPLVAWVEQGEAPTAIVASARGPGNAAGVNADVPAAWSANRTRPLCAYPQVATYKGSGSIEDANNFSCK